MALQKQNISVPFLEGIDTVNDPFLVQTGAHSDIVNGAFIKNGTIRKRNGYNKLGTKLINSTDHIPEVQSICTFNEDLIALTQDTLYTYAKENDTWRI